MSSEESQGQVTESTIEDTLEQLDRRLKIAEAEADIGELFESFSLQGIEEEENEAENRSQPLKEQQQTVLEKPNERVLDDKTLNPSGVPVDPTSRTKQKPKEVPDDKTLESGVPVEKSREERAWTRLLKQQAEQREALLEILQSSLEEEEIECKNLLRNEEPEICPRMN